MNELYKRKNWWIPSVMIDQLKHMSLDTGQPVVEIVRRSLAETLSKWRAKK